MKLPGKSWRGRPKRKCMDEVKEDIKVVCVSKEDIESRIRCKQMTKKI